MDDRRTLARLRRLYVLIAVLTWLPAGIGMAVAILIMDSRGLELAAIGAIVFAYQMCTVLLELPSGALADALSRRAVMATAAGVAVVAYAWGAVAATAWEFTGVYLLLGVVRALTSGAAEAWYVDAVHAVEPGAELHGGVAAAQAAGAVSLGAGSVGGGALALVLPLPEDGLVTSLSAPLLVSALVACALLGAVTRMRDARRQPDRRRVGRLAASVPVTVVAGVRLGLRNRVLSRLLLGFVPVGIGLTAVELLTPGRLLALTGDAGASAGAYGVIAAVGFVANASGSVSSGVLVRLLGGVPARAAAAGTLVSAAGLVVLFATGAVGGFAGTVVTACGYALMFVGLGLRGPVVSVLTHAEAGPSERATVVSIQSLLMQGGGGLAALSLPWLAVVWSVPVVWLLVGLVVAGSSVLFAGLGSRRRATVPVPVGR